MRASGGGSVKAGSFGSGLAWVTAYGGGPAKVRPSSGAFSETNLRAWLCFPPPTELIEILRRCRVNLSQFLFRSISVTVELIALFRDRGATLTPDHLSRMGRFTSDTHGRVTFRSKWLDLHTRGPSKNWANIFFFVKNEWGLLEKWAKMKDLSSPLYVAEEDIMRILKVPDIEHLLFEVRHTSRCIEEEFLFKVGLSFHAGRSDARMLKPTSKVPKPPAPTSKDHVQEARDHIYDIEVKALEHQCIEEGFIRGFLKGVLLIQRKTGVQVEGVTPSQASDDFPSGSDGDEIESELQKAFNLDMDDETVNIE
ncbi:hypothetical protein IEQ34_005482 [Dendrobium chrysotoxum]|uniref:Uncharacterized protein n=1 Tax=Dendrobium chrysotoxum TaxID=161865 RepID=A0AAV7HCD7_DENCH|nr:hypothetical protein IEQ34_005482 [Dendrobium chrysotoxum]